MQLQWKWTIPNILSLFRIVLIPVFVWLYFAQVSVLIPAGILVLSGLTDLFDGLIARKCNQISDIGKLLDPVADKLTQVTVVICLATSYPALVALVVICLVKETVQGIGTLLLLRRGDEVRGARWFGKVATFVFYGAMAIIVLVENLPSWLFATLVSLVAVVMLVAFIGYMRTFLGVRKTLPQKDEAAKK